MHIHRQLDIRGRARSGDFAYLFVRELFHFGPTLCVGRMYLAGRQIVLPALGV